MPGITVCDKCKEAHWSDVKCPKCFPKKVYTETEVQKIREQYEAEIEDKAEQIKGLFEVAHKLYKTHDGAGLASMRSDLIRVGLLSE